MSKPTNNLLPHRMQEKLPATGCHTGSNPAGAGSVESISRRMQENVQ